MHSFKPLFFLFFHFYTCIFSPFLFLYFSSFYILHTFSPWQQLCILEVMTNLNGFLITSKTAYVTDCQFFIPYLAKV
jgi:hypothetical protein